MAGGLGFEPRQAESEFAVLPLDDPPNPGSAGKPAGDGAYNSTWRRGQLRAPRQFWPLVVAGGKPSIPQSRCQVPNITDSAGKGGKCAGDRYTMIVSAARRTSDARKHSTPSPATLELTGAIITGRSATRHTLPEFDDDQWFSF